MADTFPTVPPTYASAPVSLDLRLILRQIESTIPDHIGSLSDRLLISTAPRTWAAIEVVRGPIDIKFGSSSMTLAVTVAYRGKLWRKVPLTTISASCGTGEKAPLARIRIRTAYRIDPAWHIHTKSELLEVARATNDPVDECHVTFLGINVTDKVLASARTAIEKQLKVADAQLAGVDVRGALVPVWNSLQHPLALSDSTIWLSMHPREVGIGPVTVKDSVAHATVTLLARPRISSGRKPAPDSLPLPNLTAVAPGDTLIAAIDGLLSYHGANTILRQKLKGHKLRIRGRRIVIDDVVMSYLGGNRVTLGVQVSGAAEGRVYFVGSPSYDPDGEQIVVPDLTYDIHTSNLLVKGATWLAGDKLRDEVRKQALFPVSSMLDLAVGVANGQITRTLAQGVRLTGWLGPARAATVLATGEGIRAEARGGGKLALDIKLASVFANTHIPRNLLKGIDTTRRVRAVPEVARSR